MIVIISSSTVSSGCFCLRIGCHHQSLYGYGFISEPFLMTGLKSNFPLPCWYNTHSLPRRQPLTCTQFAGIITTEPGPKSFAESAVLPVYQTPLITTFVISLLWEWSSFSVPAGTFRTCV